MSLDLDLQLRVALFDYINRLAPHESDTVASRALNEGLNFHGKRVPIWNQQKGIFRPAILRDPGAALTIQTAFDGPYDDRYDVAEDQLLYRYRGTDPNHPDNVAVRRAMELRRPLLYLVAVQPGVYCPVYPCFVIEDSPAQLAFHLMADARRDITAATDDPLGNIPLKAYATRAVKHRLHQDRFRYLVLTAYRQQCAMCRLRHTFLLDAAHIIPDRDERGAPEIPNGMSLCRIHHGAYDFGILGVDPDYRIHIRRDVLEEHDGPMLLHGLQGLHGGTIQTPKRAEHLPNREYLAERYAKFQAA